MRRSHVIVKTHLVSGTGEGEKGMFNELRMVYELVPNSSETDRMFLEALREHLPERTTGVQMELGKPYRQNGFPVESGNLGICFLR